MFVALTALCTPESAELSTQQGTYDMLSQKQIDAADTCAAHALPQSSLSGVQQQRGADQPGLPAAHDQGRPQCPQTAWGLVQRPGVSTPSPTTLCCVKVYISLNSYFQDDQEDTMPLSSPEVSAETWGKHTSCLHM